MGFIAYLNLLTLRSLPKHCEGRREHGEQPTALQVQVPSRACGVLGLRPNFPGPVDGRTDKRTGPRVRPRRPDATRIDETSVVHGHSSVKAGRRRRGHPIHTDRAPYRYGAPLCRVDETVKYMSNQKSPRS